MAYHRAVIETKKQQGLKLEICHHLTEQGNVVFPAAEDVQYLIRGQPKGVAVTSFLTHFGMKQQLEDFPYLPLE